MIRSLLKILKKSAYIIPLLFIIFASTATQVSAATQAEKDDAHKASEWDDQGTDDNSCDSTTSSTQSASTSTPGKIYLLGDSIGEGLNGTLPSQLKAEDGWSILSNTRVSRPLGEGIGIAASAPEDLKSAKYALIVLGTNPDDKLNGAGIQEMVDAIKAANPSAPIIWVGTNVTRSDLIAKAKEFNDLLRSSSQLKFVDNTIPPGSDGVHPSDYNALATLVSAAFKGNSSDSETADSSPATSCQCSSVGDPSVAVDKSFSLGSDAVQRRINLIKKLMADYGLTAEQASGIVGNFMQESGGAHLPPDVNQNDTQGAPPNSSNLGYGWAQWSGGRKHSFVSYGIDNGYVEAGQNFNDAANYAYLKSELNGTYKNAIEDLKAQSTPEDAAYSFHKIFEGSSDSPSMIGERGVSARQAFTEYSNGGSGGGTGSSGGGSGSSCSGSGSAAIVGEYAFPLITSKSAIGNRGIFKDGTTGIAGHPYTAYDILVKQSTQVVAFLGGKVTRITQDKCPGQLISVYNPDSNLTISYLHLDFDSHVSEGDELSAGQNVGLIGPADNGCGTEHLHIDAAEGTSRPGCSREKCPAENAAKFRDIGKPLFDTYQKLPEN